MTTSHRPESVGSTSAAPSPDPGGAPVREGPDRDDSDLLAALLDGMDAALCAFDADGTVTHWNREAERILGWTAAEAVGRRGLGGWAARSADAHDVESRLMAAMGTAGRQVNDVALLTKDGGRVLVRTQTSPVQRGGRPVGVYCAFSEVQTQIDLERSVALSEVLLDDAAWGVVVVDADLRPAVVNDHAARALRTGRGSLLGRPLGDVLAHGADELENALQHVLADGTPPMPAELWVTLRGGQRPDQGRTDLPGRRPGGGAGRVRPGAGRTPEPDPGPTGPDAERRCWRSGFLRLASPLAEHPVPLGVAWVFWDVTESKQAEQEGSRLRFRSNQLHRAARAAAECEDPLEAATVQLDFALAGFADHALIDLVREPAGPGPAHPHTPDVPRLPQHPPHPAAAPWPAEPAARAGRGGPAAHPPYTPPAPLRLVRAAATPAGGAALGPCACGPVVSGGIPVPYPDGHPALQAAERCGSVRISAARLDGPAAGQWAQARKWPDGTVHGLCTVLRSRGRTLGVATFLRGSGRRPFDRSDAAYAEDVSVRVAAALDLARLIG
ncbi:PAS domain-containing protein [Streptomyces sp. NPDC018031]|uniref:PAS domain-containing protein n=1 Tax=Streptomyces sp. NPDC018031 TaxID=3365033 RepID=UPI00379ABAC4